MDPKTVNPYMHIELSADSELEDNVRPSAHAGDKDGKQKKAKVKFVRPSKSKKSELIIKSAKIIRNKLDIGDIISTSDEFEKLLSEIGRMKKSIEFDGVPLSFIQIVDHLNDVVVLNKTNQDFKKKKDLSKQLNIFKKKISATFASYEDEISEAKKSPDFYKEETLEDQAEAEAVGQQLVEDKDADQDNLDQETIEDESEDEQDDMDFSKRLTLSKEERRKFWLLKPKEKKAGVKKPTKTHRAPKQPVERPKPAKRFIDEDEEFKNIDVSAAAVQKKLKDMYEKKVMYKDDELIQNFRLLLYIFDNAPDERMKTETLILILNFQLELVKIQGLAKPEFWEECFDNLKNFFVSLGDKNLRLTNYIKGVDVEYDHNDLIRLFNSFVTQFNNEIIYTVKLSDPFGEDFALRISHEIDYIEFLLQVNDFYKALPSTEAQIKYSLNIGFMIVDHIHFIPNDSVLNSEKLSKLFEAQDITHVVKKFADYVYANCKDEALIAKMQLYHAYNLGLNLENTDHASTLLQAALNTGLLSKDRYLVSLFNRCLAILGTAEFKLGNLNKCKFFLFELVNSDNMEALMCQYNPMTTNVLDFTDPLNMFPYHVHINLEEVEAAFLLASVLTESYRTVNFQDSLSKSGANKRLVKFIESYQKNLFINSMDKIFDQIFICYRKIIQYDYIAAFNAVTKIKYISNQDNYEETVKHRIKIECFNCYVEKLKSENRFVIDVQDFANVFDIPVEEFKLLLKTKIEQGDLNCHIDEKKSLLVIDNGVSGFLQNDGDFELLDSVKSFYELNGLISKIATDKPSQRSLEANEVSTFIHKKFASQDRHFNFIYDYSYFKRLLG